MITKYMNNKELYKELKSDLQNVRDYVDSVKSRYQRAIKKSNTFPIKFNPIEYTSPKHNKYSLIFGARRKNDWKNTPVSIICVYDNGKGLSTAKFNKQIDKISIFRCHFFSRYRSRYLKKDDLSAKDVILHFHTNNTNAYGEVIDDDLNFAMTCNDGVMLGAMSADNSIVVNKTFVGFDMLFDSQDEYKNEFYELLQRYQKNFEKTSA